LSLARKDQSGVLSPRGAGSKAHQEWPHYGNDPGGSRYSPLKQIDKGNVAKLAIAWTYHTGDVSDGLKYPSPSAFECTPLVIDGVLYLTTPFSRGDRP
jgi:quinoprotein glucose dehydrogenase